MNIPIKPIFLCTIVLGSSTLEAEVKLEEIVITAERRKESVQDIPFAVTALDAKQLMEAGINDTTSLNKLVTGLDFRSNSGSGVSLYIRGVGAQPLNGLVDQANAFSVDGLFFSRAQGPDMTFFDMERVEVLKGPQGTLYGRNATAGAVNVISNKPHFDGVDGFVNFTVGNYNTKQFEGAVNLPVSDTLAFRAATNVALHDGYMDDGYNDKDVQAGRLHMLWEPNSDVSLLLTADGGRRRGQGTGYIPLGPNSAENLNSRFLGDPWDGSSTALIDSWVQERAATLVPTGAPPGSGAPLFEPRSETARGPKDDGHVKTDYWGLSGTLSVQFDSLNWTTVFGYRETDTDDYTHAQWDSLYTLLNSEETSLETRLSSNSGESLEWIVGAFYFKEDIFNRAWPESAQRAPSDIFNPVFDADFIFFDASNINNESWAVFGQSTYSVASDLRFTLGLRYSEDKKTQTDGQQGYVDQPYDTEPFPVQMGPVPPSFSPMAGDESFDAVTYTIGFEWDTSANSMAYANIRKGYHAGGLIQGDSVGPNPTSYAPEELIAYAVGSKNSLFDDQLRLNLELYYWDYEDLQIPGLGLVNCRTCMPGGPIQVPQSTLGPRVTNAGAATTYGLDIDSTYLLTQNDLLTLNMLLAEGEYDSYEITELDGQTISADGSQLANLPKLSVTLGYKHEVELNDAGNLTLGGRIRYVGERELGAIEFPGSTLPDYTLVDLEATWRNQSGSTAISAYIRNVQDKTVVQSGSEFPDGVTQVAWGTLYPPRTFGVSLSFNF